MYGSCVFNFIAVTHVSILVVEVSDFPQVVRLSSCTVVTVRSLRLAIKVLVSKCVVLYHDTRCSSMDFLTHRKEFPVSRRPLRNESRGTTSATALRCARECRHLVHTFREGEQPHNQSIIQRAANVLLSTAVASPISPSFLSYGPVRRARREIPLLFVRDKVVVEFLVVHACTSLHHSKQCCVSDILQL